MRLRTAPIIAALGTLLLFSMVLLHACKKEELTLPGDLKGSSGKLRFFAKFTNSNVADIDLHVITPRGNEISYYNVTADGGQYEYDCKCKACDDGGYENIFFKDEPVKGTYTYYLHYYNYCNQEGTESSFTVYCIENGSLRQTYKGELGFDGYSGTYSFTKD